MRWEHLWIGSDIATMENNSYSLIKNGAIATCGNQIAWVGTVDELPAHYPTLADELHFLKGGVITPGLIDCHTHLVYGGVRAFEFSLRQKGTDYAEIAKKGGGIQSTVKATRKTSFEVLLKQSLQRLEKLWQEGVTTIEIKSGYGLNEETEFKMLKVAKELSHYLPIEVMTTFLGAHALPKEFSSNDEYIQYICDILIPKVAKEKLATFVDVFCEHIAFSQKQTELVFQAAQKHALKIKIHAEQLSNLRGAKLAAQYKAVSADHLEYIDELSIDAMAQNKTVAVLLPGAYYYLQEKQKPPVELFRKYNVPIAIATDCNPGSSPTTSLQTMMNMSRVLFGLTAEEALCAVTCHAAKALDRQYDLGLLKKGFFADFIHWDISHPDELSYYIHHIPDKIIIKRGVCYDHPHIECSKK